MVNFDNLDRIIKRETMKALRETMGGFMDADDQSEAERQKQKQQAKAVNSRGLKKGVAEEVDEADEDENSPEEDKREDRTGGKGTADSSKLKTPSDKTLKNVTIGSVIDKLNALRGGRSLKDKEVQRSFKQYFESLTNQERQSMLVFLTGIAQILAGTKQGKEAIDPGDVGLRVKGKTDKKDKALNKQLSPEKKTDEQPIVVGESHRRARAGIKKAIRTYKKHAS